MDRGWTPPLVNAFNITEKEHVELIDVYHAELILACTSCRTDITYITMAITANDLNKSCVTCLT